MAIYHLTAKIISRANGRSAVAAAAYRAGERLRDARAARVHDYRRKAGIAFTEILLPDGAPAAWQDRAMLWNAVEDAERRRDAQLAREIELALPRELPTGEAIRLVHDFVGAEFVRLGMIADLAVHLGRTADGEPQPHAHVMLTLRHAGPEGFGPKAREWNDAGLLLRWRERWAGFVNARLAESGHDIRVDHRSLAAQGIDLTPQTKIGPAALRMEGAGVQAERAAAHEAIMATNIAAIIANPSLALAAITRQQSTFTRADLARLLHRYTDDAAIFARALAVVEASPELVRLGHDGRGRERLTTREMLAIETDLATTGRELAISPHPALPRACWEDGADAAGLGEEQAAALAHVMGSGAIAAVVGFAGTGKSTMLGAARRGWEAAGLRVRGAALSGIAAEGLQQGAGIPSRTIASLLHQWGRGRERLTSADVLVIDEAGMIGSRQMRDLLAAVRAAGARLVLVGDPEQLQPIEAGAPFRAIVERIGAAAIGAVRRQRTAWQREATRELATARTAAALGRYEAAGMLHGHASMEAAREGVIAAWDAVRRERPEATQILLAHRRVDVRALNERARALRRAAGELGPEVTVPTAQGARPFAAGDRLYFLRNERSMGVRNGTLGTVRAIEGQGAAARLTVRLDDGREVTFHPRDYDDIDHGYAATVHRSQGVTVDHAHVLATRGMDRHTAYVALSRHREALSLHWDMAELGDARKLAAALGREGRKDMTLDYGEALPSGAGPASVCAVRRGLTGPHTTEEALRRHLAALADAARIQAQLRKVWQGTAAQRDSLAAAVSSAVRTARLIARTPGLRDRLAVVQPDLLREIERVACQSLPDSIARACQQIERPGLTAGRRTEMRQQRQSEPTAVGSEYGGLTSQQRQAPR